MRVLRLAEREDLRAEAQRNGRLWELEPLDDGPPDPRLSGPVPGIDPRAGVYLDPLYPTEGQAPFVAEIAEARLTGPVPLALTPDGRVVKQTLIAPADDDGRVDRALQEGVREQGIGATLRGLRRRAPVAALELECATLLCGRSNAYYHFVCDQLPKLRGIEAYTEATGERPTFVLAGRERGWERPLLELAGHGDAEKLPWPGGDARARRLVVPSHPEMTPGTMRWLRERIWSGVDAMPSGSEPRSGARILISRRDAGRTRYVHGEDDLAAALAPLGFELVVLSELTQHDAIRLFRGAEMVVGAHGSGLTNIVWSESASVLEVFGSSVRPYFFRLAKAAGLPYRFELAEESDGEIRIDVDRLVTAAGEMLGERR